MEQINLTEQEIVRRKKMEDLRTKELTHLAKDLSELLTRKN